MRTAEVFFITAKRGMLFPYYLDEGVIS